MAQRPKGGLVRAPIMMYQWQLCYLPWWFLIYSNLNLTSNDGWANHPPNPPFS